MNSSVFVMEWHCFLWGGKLAFNVIFMNISCLRADCEGEKEIRGWVGVTGGFGEPECITEHFTVDRAVSVTSVFLARQILQLAGNARRGAMTLLPSPQCRSASV